MIYLDHAATTPMDPRVLEAMIPYLTYDYGNPGSLHEYGRTAKDAVDKARQQVADFFYCSPEQVIFTSGGSEGNNLVIQGLENELRRRGKTDVLVSAVEHDSVLKAARKLCMKPEFHLNICNPDKTCRITTEELNSKITDKTGLVSIMASNNETGVGNPVYRIGAICHKAGILYHCDAVQTAGITDLDTEDLFCDADFMTISGHKINGPKGTGAVFARNPELLSPLICGGEEQEFGLRGGTENVPGIIGLGKACELTQKEVNKHYEYLRFQHSQLIFMLKYQAKQKGIELRINGESGPISPKTLNICLPGIDAQSLLLLLDSCGIFVSAGSACTAHENHPSHVLKAMGLSDEDANSSIRISISHVTTPEELDEAAQEIIRCACVLRGISNA